MSAPPLDPQFRAVRLAYGAFYLLALPLFLFLLSCFFILWRIWSNRGNGLMKEEAIDAEAISAFVGAAVFVVCYVTVWLLAPRITQPQRAWLPFAVQIPALIFLLVVFSRGATLTLSDRLYPIGYFAILLLVLVNGIYFAFRASAKSETSQHQP